MTKKTLLFSLFFLSALDLSCAEENLITTSKAIKPNWRPQIVETFDDPSKPKQIIYYEPSDKSEIPVKITTYYENGQLKSETDVLFGNGIIVFSGPSITYDEDNKIVAIDFYKDGLLEGTCKTFYSSGILKNKIFFRKGTKNGGFERYHANGELRMKGEYKNDALHGKVEEFYDTGLKASLKNYLNGVYHGECTEWYPNQHLKATYYYNLGFLQNIPEHPAVTEFYENRITKEIQNYQWGQPHGDHFIYYPSGEIKYKISYVSGKKHGKELFSAKDGSVIGSGEYIQNIPFGIHEKKHLNGSVAFFAEYNSQGILVKPIQEFSEDDKLFRQYFVQGNEYQGQYLEWYPNANIHKKYNFKCGEFDGEQCEHFPSGNLKKKCTYSNGLKHGIFQEFNENQMLLLEATYNNGSKNGYFREWYDSGKPKKEKFYKNDLLQGQNKEWNENGSVLFVGEYVEGQPIGIHKEYYENGSLKSEIHYTNGSPSSIQKFHPNNTVQFLAKYNDNKIDGDLIEKDEKGNLLRIEHYSKGIPFGQHIHYFPASCAGSLQIKKSLQYENGNLHMKQISYYENGIKEALIEYKQGILHGVKAFWNELGTLLEEYNYNEGMLHGRFYQLLSDGNEVIYHYENNKLHGLHQIFHPEVELLGKVKALEANFVNGLLDGEISEFNETGTKIASTFYHKGKKNGFAALFAHDGHVVMSGEFLDDKQHGMAYEFFPNGTSMRETMYVNDLKDGEERTFFPDGTVASSYHFSQGKLDGLGKEWNADGILIFEAEYSEGKKNGKFNKYTDKGKPKLFQIYQNDKLIKKVLF